MSESRANQIWLVLLAMVTALTATVLLQAGLLAMTMKLLKSLVPVVGAKTAVHFTAGLQVLIVVVFIVVLAGLLEQTLGEGSDWRWMPRAAGLLGLMVIVVSVLSLQALDGFARAQLVATFVWALFAFWLSRGASPVELRLPRPWTVPSTPIGELVAMTRHLLVAGLLLGLLGFVLSETNLLMLVVGLSPELTDTVYQHGFKLGILVALLFTPATRPVRTPLVVGYLIDWVGGAILPPVVVPAVQFLSIVAATMLTKQPFVTAWRLSVGMCAGRILGRAIGAVLVGAEGVTLMEPLIEVTLGVVMTEGTPASEPHPSPEPPGPAVRRI